MMVKLKGAIGRETPDSVEFHVVYDECGRIDGQTEWFAKKYTRLPKKRNGMITIKVWNWLYETKIIVTPENM